jgi:ornithine cyclodeaminase/alanine dehydrogenase-like protein (mu-crystallin family)
VARRLSFATALREAGDVILAVEAGATTAEELMTLSELVRNTAEPRADRPRLFKRTGMAWEDAVVASTLLRAG